MDKEQAIREVHEIKHIMEESQRRMGHSKYWICLALALLGIVVSAFVPVLGPVIGIGLIVGGIFTWRRSYDSTTKTISGVLIAAGIIVLFLATVFIAFGVMVFSSTTGSSIMIGP
jgi:hypothetical protein